MNNLNTPSAGLKTPPQQPELLAEGGMWRQRLEQAMREQGLSGLAPALLDSLEWACACSPFIAKALISHPEWLAPEPLDLRQPFSAARFAESEPALLAANTERFMGLLRRLRQREMVRIGLRDLWGWASLEESLAALSNLAEFCIRQADAKAYALQSARYGVPVDTQGLEQSLPDPGHGQAGWK